MPGLPHDAVAAALGDVVVHVLGTLDLGDDRGAGVALKHVPGQDQEQHIAADDVAVFVHDADAVAVA